jgi:hypothetical protein
MIFKTYKALGPTVPPALISPASSCVDPQRATIYLKGCVPCSVNVRCDRCHFLPQALAAGQNFNPGLRS